MLLPRLLLTLAVALSLSGLYCAYAIFTRPLLTLPTLSVVAPVGPMNAPPRPVENVRVAETHLPQQEWAANAKYHLKSHDAYIYANDWEMEGDSGRVRLKPFAMVWMSKNTKTGDTEPVTVVSESALVRFAGNFEMPNPNPGRLVHAILSGRAQINGPNGMVIDGREFTFSEAANRLWSDYQVRYEYAGNRGRADILEIDLIPQEGEPGKDRPHIFGIRNVRLSRNVVMELQLKENEKPFPLKVKCKGSFQFSVLDEMATFREGVIASRQTGPAAFDWIDCEHLAVQFETPDDGRPSRPLPLAGQTEQYQQLDSRLKFVRLQADAAEPTPHDEAPPLIRLFSIDHQLEARATQLQYDGQQQQIRLSHPQGVQVLHAESPVLQCPEVVLTLGDGQQLKSALCRGAGWLLHRDEQTKTIDFAADWKTQLRHMHDVASGLDFIELQERASLRQPVQEMALGAEVIRAWLRQPPKSEQPDQKAGKAGSLPLTSGVKQITAERFEAEKDVVFVSPQLEGQSRKLEVWLDHSLPPVDPVQRPSPRSEANPQEPASGASSQKNPGDKMEPVAASADTIRVRLRPGSAKTPDVADLWADGRVALQQKGQSDGQPVSALAEHAHVVNHGGNRQHVRLEGRPAHLSDQAQGIDLEAGVMHLDRADNQFVVEGSGTLQLPVKSDLDGKPLSQPGQLVVAWRERMTFDGLLATFRGQASAELENRRLSCEKMEITLSQAVKFDDPPRKGGKKLDVQAIACRDHVELKSQVYKDSKLVEIQTAEAWELRLDQATGKMFAQGPGVMSMWRRGSQPRSGLLPQQSASANSPIQVDTSEWQFTRVKFDGQMTGQIEHRHAVFRERVEILHGPVKLPNQILTRDQLPKGGGFMSCQELQVKQIPGTNGGRNLLQIAGDGNAWLEGEGFAASADKIVYDEVREAYLIYGKGRNNARFWHNVTPGVESEPASFQRGEFILPIRKLTVDSISSAEGAR